MRDIANGRWALDAICRELSIARPEPHNALADVRALQVVLATRTGKTTRSATLLGKMLRKHLPTS